MAALTDGSQQEASSVGGVRRHKRVYLLSTWRHSKGKVHQLGLDGGAIKGLECDKTYFGSVPHIVDSILSPRTHL